MNSSFPKANSDLSSGDKSVKLVTACQYLTLPAAEGVTASDFVLKTELTQNTTGILMSKKAKQWDYPTASPLNALANGRAEAVAVSNQIKFLAV